MTVSIQTSGPIAHVIIDNPPVNALSQAVRQGLRTALRRIEADDAVQAVILSCAGRTFVAGADVNEFDRPPEAPHLPDVIAEIEASPKPWAAVLHGTALGGGLELALGCRWRLATMDAKLGLPETILGLLPGAGGTVRTPRLTGVPVAVAMMTSGKPVTAAQALDSGLIDAVLDGDLLPAAEAWLTKALHRPLPLPVSARPLTAPAPGYWDEVAPAIRKSAKGNAGPEEALAAIRRATELPFDQAMAAERAAFLRLRASDQAAALRHIFFAERAAPRPAELKGIAPLPLAQIGVVGGGTMGAGIAVAALNAGLRLCMIERDDAAVARGRSTVEAIITADANTGRITADGAADRLARFQAASTYGSLADCDLVIEAVFEELAVKRAVFAELAQHCRADAILATNTSYLNPETIGEGLPNPTRFLGLHFFSPANIMKLLEIVPTSATSPAVLASAFELARRLGKIPVRAGICGGFIGNRLLKLTRTQAERLVLAGATPPQVDGAMRAFGFAMGPFQTQDLAGLDIGAFQRQAARARGETAFAPVADRLVALGRLGRKTRAGWYDADSHALPPPVADAIAAARAEAGTTPRAFSDAEIVAALLYPMIDEAATIVAEGIALRDGDVDLVKVHGYGFPRHRGGPLCHGRQIGFHTVAEGLTRLAAEGLSPTPSPALLKRVAQS